MSAPDDGSANLEAAVVMADTTGRITAWNDAAARGFGHSAAEAVGQTLDLIVPPQFRDAHWSGFRRAMATGECTLDRAATNLPVLHADGEIRLYPGRFVFLTDPRGAPVGALAVFADPVGGEAAWGPVLPRPAETP